MGQGLQNKKACSHLRTRLVESVKIDGLFWPFYARQTRARQR